MGGVPLDIDDGLPEACAVTLDTVRPVRRSLLTVRITALGPARMRAVSEALTVAVAWR